MKPDLMKHIFHISQLLLVTAAVYFGVSGFYKYIEGMMVYPDLKTTPDQIVRSERNEKHYQRADYETIVLRDLFHTSAPAKEKIPKTEIDLDSLKNTDLKLKLWGTVSTDKESIKRSRAVIEDTQARQQDLYQAGDVVQNATIVEILRKSVVLEVNGRLEKLSIAEEKIASGETDSERVEYDNVAAPAASGAVALKRSQVDAAMKDINTLMQDVRIEPVFQDGKPEGVALSKIGQNSIIREMGLRAGDIITGVNGQKIDSVDNALKFYESLSSGSRLTIELKRRGRPTTIDYIIE